MSPQKLMPQRCMNTVLVEEEKERTRHASPEDISSALSDGNSDCKGLFLPGAMNEEKEACARVSTSENYSTWLGQHRRRARLKVFAKERTGGLPWWHSG